MLGSTFNFVFETQMEMLQDGDRFYYLSRVQGLNLLNELEANFFSALVMRNSDLGDAGSSHLPAHLFQTPDLILEVNKAVQTDIDPKWGNAVKDLLFPLVVRRAAGADVDGDGAADGAYLKYSGDGHVVLGGSAGNDTLIGGKGIDSLITDTGTPIGGADFLHGDAWLNVRIAVSGMAGVTSADSMNELKSYMLAGTLKPNQLSIVREIVRDGDGLETDVALYRDISSNYLFNRNADGSLTVNHATPAAGLAFNDGIDRLLNIEKLEFGNGEQLWVMAQSATGDLTISDSTPEVGDLLRVNVANLQDGNGIAANAAITLTWQALVAGQWRDQATGAEFRVPGSILGAPLRVIASFTDMMGDAERLVSTQTGAVMVRDQPTTGAPVISDLTPTESVTLTAIVSGIADSDGLTGGNFTYQWRMSTGGAFTNIAGATAATYTPGQNMIGRTLQVLVTVTDDEGNPSVVLTSGATQPIGDMVVGNNSANTLVGTAWSDVLLGEGGNDTLLGQAGDDLLNGGAGNDSLDGGRGLDTLLGDAGNDRLVGGLDADNMAGGAGDDIYIVDNAGDVVTEGVNAGNDTVQTDLNTYVMTENVEVLVFTGQGNFTATGNALANTITGGSGNDRLSGMGGNDQLSEGIGNDVLDGGEGDDNLQGANGNDNLSGGAGIDVLSGGIGVDVLNGGTGNDSLDGGTGDDFFAFGTSFGRDRITGFDSDSRGGQGLMDISLLGITTASFASRVAISASAGDALVTIDGNVITLAGVTGSTVNVSDFIL